MLVASMKRQGACEPVAKKLMLPEAVSRETEPAESFEVVLMARLKLKPERATAETEPPAAVPLVLILEKAELALELPSETEPAGVSKETEPPVAEAPVPAV